MLQCGALRCGAAGMEEISWSGEGPGSQWSPLLFDIVTPRRSTTMTRGPGEGRAGLAGRDETRLAGTECTVGVAVVVVAGLDRVGPWNSDL